MGTIRAPLLLVLSIGPLWVMTFHPDCNHDRVLSNFARVCKAYPNIKRSTPDLNQVQGGYWDRGIKYGVGRPPYPDNSGRGGYFTESRGWGLQPEGSLGGGMYPPEPPIWGKYPDPTAVAGKGKGNEDYPIEWLFNPLDYEGETQLPLERWRREKRIREELRRFLKDKCCNTGCSFPDDYIELDRRLRIFC